MRIFIVDRFEDKFVICEGDEKRMFAILREEAPDNVKEGDCLVIDGEGNISIDAELTAQRRAQINKKRGR